MMNNVSLSARKLYPKQSIPGELQDFELIFYGSQGMAAAKPASGKSFHGVLHKMTDEDMKALDKIEATVSRTEAKAKLYDGTIVDCTCYSNPPKEDPSGAGNTEDKPPTERYIDIMVEGARNHKVDENYIQGLLKMDSQPRTKVADFEKWERPADLPTWTMKEVEAGTGGDGQPMYSALNGVVVECLLPKDAPFYGPTQNLFAGKHMEIPCSTTWYEPKYGLPDSIDKFT